MVPFGLMGINQPLRLPKNRSTASIWASGDKFVRILQTAVTTTDGLMSADRKSLYAAAMKAAQDGLLPDGREASIVPFGNKATYIPMVRGLIKNIYRSDKIDSISTGIVYENDEFEYTIDENGEHLSHKPKVFGERGKKIGVYALARFKTGTVLCELMEESDIQTIKSNIKQKSGPWFSGYENEMWKKSCLKRLIKRLPIEVSSVFKEPLVALTQDIDRDEALGLTDEE